MSLENGFRSMHDTIQLAASMARTRFLVAYRDANISSKYRAPGLINLVSILSSPFGTDPSPNPARIGEMSIDEISVLLHYLPRH